MSSLFFRPMTLIGRERLIRWQSQAAKWRRKGEDLCAICDHVEFGKLCESHSEQSLSVSSMGWRYSKKIILLILPDDGSCDTLS